MANAIVAQCCIRCGEEKPLSDFSPNRRMVLGGRRTCKPCSNKTARAWNRAHPEQMRDKYMRRKYGLSMERYQELLQEQGGVCAICGRVERRRTKFGEVWGLVVDHDHETGELRGLLCGDCNVAIGMFGDDPGRLLNGVVYLERYRGK